MTIYKMAVEIKDSWFGVKIPAWLRAFDCRNPDDGMAEGVSWPDLGGILPPEPRAPWGQYLWSSERAGYDLGLILGYGANYMVTPLSCQAYTDFRTSSQDTLNKTIVNMIAEAKILKRNYNKTCKNPAKSGDGGAVQYKPLAIVLSNYGWSIVADSRISVAAGLSA